MRTLYVGGGRGVQVGVVEVEGGAAPQHVGHRLGGEVVQPALRIPGHHLVHNGRHLMVRIIALSSRLLPLMYPLNLFRRCADSAPRTRPGEAARYHSASMQGDWCSYASLTSLPRSSLTYMHASACRRLASELLLAPPAVMQLTGQSTAGVQGCSADAAQPGSPPSVPAGRACMGAPAPQTPRPGWRRPAARTRPCPAAPSPPPPGPAANHHQEP